jgi:hypothetical protein
MAPTDSSGPKIDIQTESVEVISDSDTLARQVIYPAAFDGALIGANALIQFLGDRNDDGSFTESLMLERLTTQQAIHFHGCKSAKRKNEKQRLKREKAAKFPVEPVPGEDRHYYCGYTRSQAKPLYIKTARYFIDLTVEEDDGEPAHVTIALRPTDLAAKLKPNDKTEAGRLLALMFADPQPHVCAEDQNDASHPINRWGAEALVMKSAA